MSNARINVENVSKTYLRYRSEFYRFLSWFGFPSKPIETSTVLNNISFSVSEGEAVALVGENGAGKSTILKAITGTIQPSSGTINVNGKISAVLELGLGFNPEMTGRQNVHLAGGVLGYKDAEISQLENSIHEFSELDDYFDQPVRTYSSGMQARLAFSVATATRPDILIVDEALSVGDAYFQHKSFNRIKEFREQGTTLLFVSHDRSAVQSLCDRAILLEKGNVLRDGSPEEIMDFYNALIAEKENQNSISQVKTKNGKVVTRSGTGEANVVSTAVLDLNGQPLEIVNVGQEVTLQINVVVSEDLPKLVLGYGIKDRLGQVMFGTNTELTQQALLDVKKGSTLSFNIQFKANLGPGSYSIQTALTSSDTHLVNNYEWQDNAHIFEIINVNKNHFAGCNWMEPKISIEETKR